MLTDEPELIVPEPVFREDRLDDFGHGLVLVDAAVRGAR
jgi:hypothetical protein